MGSLCYAPDHGSPGVRLRAAIIWSVTQGSLPFLSGVGAEGLGSSGRRPGSGAGAAVTVSPMRRRQAGSPRTAGQGSGLSAETEG